MNVAGFDLDDPGRMDPGQPDATTFVACNLPSYRDEHAHGSAALCALTASELLAHPFPVQEPILAPWLLSQSLSMIHAWRGVGKTHVALNIAVAVSTGGSFLRWKAPRARNVLYVDGEMPGYAIQGRVRALMASKGLETNQVDRLRFVTPDAINGPMPDLVSRSGQLAIENLAADTDLIVLDNISTLFRANGAENEAESWRVPQEWALKLRQRGKAVLFIHHSGKNGGQRGSSKREDTLDVVIHLRNSADHCPADGARFELHFEKFRHGFGEDAAAMDIAMVQCEGGRTEWRCAQLRQERAHDILRLRNEGKSQREIAATLGISAATVNRALATTREHEVPTLVPSA